MINYCSYITPFICRIAESNPPVILRVRSAYYTFHRGLYANITNGSYIMDSYLSEIHFTPAKASYLFNLLYMSFRRIIPLFLRPRIYNTKKYLTKKCYKYNYINYNNYNYNPNLYYKRQQMNTDDIIFPSM